MSYVAWNVGSPDTPVNGARVAVSTSNQSHDYFDGGAGNNDWLVLTDGNDALFLHDPYSPFPLADPNSARIVDIEFIDAGAGDDIIDLTSPTLSYGDVVLAGGPGNDVLWSSAGNDLLYGEDGDDILDAGSGNDKLYGGDGQDTLYSRSGNDQLFGNDGDDILHGGEGVDLFSGGAGIDTIIYDMFDTLQDGIVGFTTGIGGDILDLSAILSYDPANDVLSDFVQLAANGSIGGTDLLVNVNGDGGGFTALANFDVAVNDPLADLIANGNLLVESAIAAVLLDADFDGSGQITGQDFLAWQRGFGTTTSVGPASGDANGDGVVDAEDLSVFQDQFGTIYIHGNGRQLSASSSALAGQAVPEPISLVMLTVAALLSCTIRRKKGGR